MNRPKLAWSKSRKRCEFYPIQFAPIEATINPACVATGLPTPAMEVEEVENTTNGARLMPMRVLGPILSFIIPTAGWPWWALAIQAAIASLAFTLASMNLVLRWMIFGVCFDIFTGLLCGLFLPGPFRPSVVAKGILVKGACIWMVIMFARQPELQVDLWSRTWSLGELLGVWYLTSEWISAAKNLDALGMPFPKFIKSMLANVHSSIDNADIGGQAISIFTSFSKRTNGGVQTVKETTSKTTVTSATPPAEKP